jgi:hypothetical protein
VHHADRGIAVAHVFDHDPYPDQVVDIVEIATAHDHLLVDRVVVLGPAFDGGGDPRTGQLRGDLIDHRPQVGVA